MVADPDVEYTTTPANTMAFAEFMHKVWRLKKKPESWKNILSNRARFEGQLENEGVGSWEWGAVVVSIYSLFPTSPFPSPYGSSSVSQ
jgi:hypothetical protein